MAMVDASFAFLRERGFGEPRVTGSERECTIVYWGPTRTNIAIYNDVGSEAWVQIVPLDLVDSDGSTRTFGLNEAAAILEPENEPPASTNPVTDSAQRAWLTWYARLLEAHFDELVPPSPTLLDAMVLETSSFAPSRCVPQRAMGGSKTSSPT
ncbi:MAG TPA: hypothetical protein VFG83_00255 [Kofleriaceae bacterium]|nr:hypothetical protein [Kofleriaceae bacterium]